MKKMLLKNSIKGSNKKTSISRKMISCTFWLNKFAITQMKSKTVSWERLSGKNKGGTIKKLKINLNKLSKKSLQKILFKMWAYIYIYF